VRPSTRSTVKVSSVTATCAACARRGSVAKVCLPGPQQSFQVLFNYTLQSADFHSIEPVAFLQSDRAQPEFGNFLVAFDVNVGWFNTVARVEEEPVWGASEDGRHVCGILHAAQADHHKYRSQRPMPKSDRRLQKTAPSLVMVQRPAIPVVRVVSHRPESTTVFSGSSAAVCASTSHDGFE